MLFRSGIIRDVSFHRKPGISRNDQLPSRKRGKYAILWVAGRPCGSSRSLFSFWTHGASGTLRPLRACYSLRSWLPAFTGTAGRTGFSSGTHRPRFAAFAGWAEFSSGIHRPRLHIANAGARRVGFYAVLTMAIFFIFLGKKGKVPLVSLKKGYTFCHKWRSSVYLC